MELEAMEELQENQAYIPVAMETCSAAAQYIGNEYAVLSNVRPKERGTALASQHKRSLKTVTILAAVALLLATLALIIVCVSMIFVFKSSPVGEGETELWESIRMIEKEQSQIADFTQMMQLQLNSSRTIIDNIQGALTCEELSPPDNGAISMVSGPNSLSRGMGSVATYSCHPGYALLGQAAIRTSDDTNGEIVTTGTWRTFSPSCHDTILCSEPSDGRIRTELGFQLLGMGTTATYSCDSGYALVGETTSNCEDTNGGTVTTGTWSGLKNLTCAIPDTALIDCSCHSTTCNSEQLMCPEQLQDRCTIRCENSEPSPSTAACFQTGLACPSRGGDCTVNCDDSNTCQEANITCSQGNCRINCNYHSSCRHLTASCSGESCLINCKEDYSCARSTLKCTDGNCTFECRDLYSCQYSRVLCPPNGYCSIYCDGHGACQSSDFNCPAGGNCLFHFEGSHFFDWVGALSSITCQENSTCLIVCAGSDISNDNQCRSSTITCPRDSGTCTVECSGYEACYNANIVCGRDRYCLNCIGEDSCKLATISLVSTSDSVLNCSARDSCQSASITCPANSSCTINCDGPNSCNSATVTCPSGDYSCNILCTDPLSCSSLSITNTHNVYLQCCRGQTGCAGTSVTPASTECQ